jgi:hypothetical protein
VKRAVFEVEADEVALSLKFASAKVTKVSRSRADVPGNVRQGDISRSRYAVPALCPAWRAGTGVTESFILFSFADLQDVDGFGELSGPLGQSGFCGGCASSLSWALARSPVDRSLAWARLASLWDPGSPGSLAKRRLPGVSWALAWDWLAVAGLTCLTLGTGAQAGSAWWSSIACGKGLLVTPVA